MTRQELQDEAVQIGIDNPYVVFELPTGTGKTLAAIRLIEEVGGFWHIVLAETTHEITWRKEFAKHKKKKFLKNVKFYCYPSLKKNLDGENYIFDEVHHIGSDKRLQILEDIHLGNLKRFVGLSATLTWLQKDRIKEMIGDFVVFKKTLKEAIEWGLLPEPVVYMIGTTLDNNRRNLKFTFKKDQYVMCTEKEYYDRITQKVESLRSVYFSSQAEFHRIRWMNAASDRKRFLSSTKTVHAKKVLEHVEGKRLICFTGSIAQSEELSGGLSVHSKKSRKVVAQIINDFDIGKTDKIFATAMLREGVNLDDIEVGIIIQLDNVTRYFTQIHGRTLRSKYPEQYVMYVKGTQDETYIKTALSEFNMNYVQFINVKDL